MPTSSAAARWTYAFAGGLLALAMIAAVFLLFDPMGSDGDDTVDGAPIAVTSTPAASPEATQKPKRGKQSPKASPSAQPSEQKQPTGDENTAAVYYAGETAAGTRLFREFRRIRGTSDLDRAVNALESEPLDPDYRRSWSPGSIEGADYLENGDTGLVRVGLAASHLRTPPGAMGEAEALAAVQALVYTVQGAVQRRAAVEFVADGKPLDQVYGVDTSEPITNNEALATLNLMSITTPEQGSTQAGTMKLSGVGSSFEASVTWRIVDADGDVAKRGVTTAEGWLGDRLYPWSDTVNVSKLPAGDYLFSASTDDPTAGTEGSGPAVDTKRFTIN